MSMRPPHLPGKRKPVRSSANEAMEQATQWLRSGVQQKQQGRVQEAEQAFIKASDLAPHFAETHNQLGILLFETGRLTKGVASLEKAVKQDRKNPNFRFNLANAYFASEEFEKAARQAQKALSIEPGMIVVELVFARAQAHLGKTEDSIKRYQKYLASKPDDHGVMAELGDLYVDAGLLDLAESMLRKAGEAPSVSARVAIGLANLRKLDARDPLIEEFLSEADNSERLEHDRAIFHEALGGIFSQHKDWKRAFGHYEKSKQLMGEPADISKFKHFVDRSIQICTPDFLERGQRVGNKSAKPVLVVGMPRSGTSLVEQIITSHPQADGGGELGDMERFAHELMQAEQEEDAAFVDALQSMPNKWLSGAAARYLKTLSGISSKADRVVDKMPGNFKRLALINLMFPNARIIHCTRDPMDTCVSCFTNGLYAHAYSRDLTTLGEYYRQYIRLMQHWTSAMPNQILEVSYEDLVSDPEPSVRRMLDFIGLDWNDQCLSFHQTERTVKTHSRVQVRQPIYQTSVKRWKHYESYLEPLKTALGDLVVED